MNEEYLYSCPGSDQYRRYGVCEADEGGRYMVCWRTLGGGLRHPLRRLGVFDGIEQANAALLDLARKLRMSQWVERDCQGLMVGRWERIPPMQD